MMRNPYPMCWLTFPDIQRKMLKASSYKVSIYNVYGESFRLERGSFNIQFGDNKTINLDFKFTEQRRAIQFLEGEELFQFNLGNGN